MSLRAFLDSGGNEWHVFDVVPRTGERRNQERRVSASAEQQLGADRRDGNRRLGVGGVARALAINSEGWLCFERGSDRRRLSPIPTDWNRCPDETLEAYCRRARPVRRLHADVAGG
jgi:hypothetical protein